MLLIADEHPVDDVNLLRGSKRPSPLRPLAAIDGDALIEVWPELLLLNGIVPELAPADPPRQPGYVHDVLLLFLRLFPCLVHGQLPELFPELAHLDAKRSQPFLADRVGLHRDVWVRLGVARRLVNWFPLSASPWRGWLGLGMLLEQVKFDIVDANILVGISTDGDHPAPHQWQFLWSSLSLLHRRLYFIFLYFWVMPVQMALQKLWLPVLAIFAHDL
jgi:hypothetical protein